MSPLESQHQFIALKCSSSRFMPELAGRRAICGDGAIGKTCVLNRYMYLKDDFSDAPDGYEPTIFEDQNCEAELGNYGLQACKVTLRAITGHEAFDAINQASSRAAGGHYVIQCQIANIYPNLLGNSCDRMYL